MRTEICHKPADEVMLSYEPEPFAKAVTILNHLIEVSAILCNSMDLGLIYKYDIWLAVEWCVKGELPVL